MTDKSNLSNENGASLENPIAEHDIRFWHEML